MKSIFGMKNLATLVAIVISLVLFPIFSHSENIHFAKKVKKVPSFSNCLCLECNCKCKTQANKKDEIDKRELKETKNSTKVDYGVIDTKALEAIINSKLNVVIIDARSGKWDDGKRIPTAVQLSPDASEKEIEAIIKNKDQLVVTYCGGITCHASKKLAKKLINLGYKNILEYPEGIKGWIEAGLPVENAK